jgi:hypothetical protein
MTGAGDLLEHLDRRSRTIAILRSATNDYEAAALGLADARRYLLEAAGAPQSWV